PHTLTLPKRGRRASHTRISPGRDEGLRAWGPRNPAPSYERVAWCARRVAACGDGSGFTPNALRAAVDVEATVAREVDERHVGIACGRRGQCRHAPTRPGAQASPRQGAVRGQWPEKESTGDLPHRVPA